MKRTPLLTILWVLSGCLLVWALLWEGKMIGGVKYFVHVGMGGSAFLQLGLIVGSFSIALSCLYSPSAVRSLSSVMAVAASFFTMCFVAVPLPYFIAATLGYFSPILFPYSNAGAILPFLVAVLALWTRAKYAPLDNKIAVQLRIKQLVPMRATAYFLCATLTAVPVFYSLVGTALALLKVQIPYPLFLSFLFSFSPLVPQMLRDIVPESLTVVLLYAIIFLALRRCWLFAAKRERTPASFNGFQKVLGYLGFWFFSIGVLFLLLSMVFKVGLPVKMLMMPAINCASWAFFLTEVISFKRKVGGNISI